MVEQWVLDQLMIAYGLGWALWGSFWAVDMARRMFVIAAD